ncbi:unnamed protein product [Boreogadus saida]
MNSGGQRHKKTTGCGTDRIAFPPPKVGVTRTLPYPTRHHSGDCSVAVPKTPPGAVGREWVLTAGATEPCTQLTKHRLTALSL